VGKQNPERMEAIRVLLVEQGFTSSEVARQLGVSVSTVSHYARRLGVEPTQQPRYDWVEVQRYYDEESAPAVPELP
jgi:transcriptional regulator with XRE-family HTH domain